MNPINLQRLQQTGFEDACAAPVWFTEPVFFKFFSSLFSQRLFLRMKPSTTVTRPNSNPNPKGRPPNPIQSNSYPLPYKPQRRDGAAHWEAAVSRRGNSNDSVKEVSWRTTRTFLEIAGDLLFDPKLVNSTAVQRRQVWSHT